MKLEKMCWLRACGWISLNVWTYQRSLVAENWSPKHSVLWRLYLFHFPNHPCMVYLPTLWLIFYGKCRYINVPYMDALGLGELFKWRHHPLPLGLSPTHKAGNMVITSWSLQKNTLPETNSPKTWKCERCSFPSHFKGCFCFSRSNIAVPFRSEKQLGIWLDHPHVQPFRTQSWAGAEARTHLQLNKILKIKWTLMMKRDWAIRFVCVVNLQ